jgi:hypothetical protein
MEIKFIELQLTNFKSHQDLIVKFGDLTKILGDNAKGKSTIPQAITWLFFGTDTFGNKLDPSPVTYEADETKVSLLFEIDEKKVLLGRQLKKGKASYYVNEVPSKAGDFNAVVETLGEKDFFLSLFNPGYFPSLHWEKQRAMILQYVTTPSNKEVLKALPELQANKLAELVKKNSLDDLKKFHSENKTKMEKAHIAAEAKVKTLKEQLDYIGPAAGDPQALEEEAEELRLAIVEADKAPAEAYKKNQEYNKVKSELGMIQHQIEMSKEGWPKIKNEPIEDTCRTCKRPLDEESVKVVQVDKEKRMAEYKTKHNQLKDKKTQLQEQLAGMEFIDITEEQNKVRELESKRDKIADSLRAFKQLEILDKQITEAEKDEKEKLANLKESIFILDSIKDFRAKEAELQGEKVQALFSTLSVCLFKEQKNGDFKPTFEIEMDGKAYSKLSLSESIRAGLELREVLSEQSEVVAPCMVDNAESITKFKEPSGQLIISRVVAGQELEVKSE